MTFSTSKKEGGRSVLVPPFRGNTVHDSVLVEVTVHLCRFPSGGHLPWSCVAASRSCHRMYHIMERKGDWSLLG